MHVITLVLITIITITQSRRPLFFFSAASLTEILEVCVITTQLFTCDDVWPPGAPCDAGFRAALDLVSSLIK